MSGEVAKHLSNYGHEKFVEDAHGQSVGTVLPINHILGKLLLTPPIRSRGNAPRMTTLRMSGGASQWRATGGGTKATNFFVSLTIILISSKHNFVIEFDINLRFRCKFMS